MFIHKCTTTRLTIPLDPVYGEIVAKRRIAGVYDPLMIVINHHVCRE